MKKNKIKNNKEKVVDYQSQSNGSQYDYIPEQKDISPTKGILSKFDFDLFDENKNIVEKVYRVKHTNFAQKERWKIMENNDTVFIIEGAKLGKKEKEFLRTPQGFNFLLKTSKTGLKNFSAFKTELKNQLKTLAETTKSK